MAALSSYAAEQWDLADLYQPDPTREDMEGAADPRCHGTGLRGIFTLNLTPSPGTTVRPTTLGAGQFASPLVHFARTATDPRFFFAGGPMSSRSNPSEPDRFYRTCWRLQTLVFWLGMAGMVWMALQVGLAVWAGRLG